MKGKKKAKQFENAPSEHKDEHTIPVAKANAAATSPISSPSTPILTNELQPPIIQKVINPEILSAEPPSGQNVAPSSNQIPVSQPPSVFVPASVDTNVSPFPQAGSEPGGSPLERKNKYIFILGAVFLALIFLATGAITVLQHKTIQQEKTRKPVLLEVTPQDNKTNEAKPTPMLDKSEWTFEVLNGSGVTGAAGKAAKTIANLGYTVFKTDNADKKTYTGIQLFVVGDKLDKADVLLDDVKKEFPSATLSGKFTTDSTASARIIVGKE